MKNVPHHLVLFAAGTLLLVSCSSVYSPLSKTPGAMYKKGVLGGTVVESYQLTATVMAIDVPARTLSLVAKDGQKATVKCDSSVANFARLRAGDVVTAIVMDELRMTLADTNAPLDSTANPAESTGRPTEPGELVPATQCYTATIQAINLNRNQVTLSFPDSTKRTFEVRKSVDLARRKIGERVAFQVTVGTAVAVVQL
jgi:hypothetical protein